MTTVHRAVEFLLRLGERGRADLLLLEIEAGLAAALRGRSTNGWGDWALVSGDRIATLADLRASLLGPVQHPTDDA